MENNNTAYMISPDSINEGVAVFRYSGAQSDKAWLEYANPALCGLLHFSLDAMKGAEYASIFASVHPDDVEKLWGMIRALPQIKAGSCTYRFKDFVTGEYKWLVMHGQYTADQTGCFACYTYSDISPQVAAMEREQRLSRCIRLITDEAHFAANMQKMMGCLLEQYQADRAYIFEFDWANNIMHNRIEATAENVAPAIDSLQNLPVEIIRYWLPLFQNGQAVFIEDLETIRDEPNRQEEYDVLAVQDICSLMVLPVSKGDELYGYVGVDNPHVHFGDKKFLNSIATILAQEYQNKLQKFRLTELSLRDPLTNVNNRHAYNQRVDRLEAARADSVGVLFTDVNGLKYVNDRYGHREGDELILRAVKVLEKYFERGNLYRISGDEFVVLTENIPEEDFHFRVKKMKMDVSTEYGAIFSIGEIWCQDAIGIEKQVQRAEEIMYVDKRAFYARFPERSRGK